MDRNEIDDEVCALMVDHGPDGHVDGHDLLTEMVVRRVSEAVAEERERCAMVALAWGETHDPSETVNARNAARKIACGIQGPNTPVALDRRVRPHVSEACFGKTNKGKTVNVYDALLRDGREKRAAAEVRPVSVDSVPTTAQVWRVLRGLYGEKLIGVTVVAVIDGDEGVTIQTVTTDANPRAGA